MIVCFVPNVFNTHSTGVGEFKRCQFICIRTHMFAGHNGNGHKDNETCSEYVSLWQGYCNF